MYNNNENSRKEELHLYSHGVKFSYTFPEAHCLFLSLLCVPIFASLQCSARGVINP